ncbi:unnamed protein product (macronuclear) [Paramecium tetraurelia]|uniref:Uncharacterized protein n=1 Tax=Paramecium tetraurelia TaxID=5888 RepID=A0CK09_PARTE|nr:uncharacterized protein GSPATT00000838001 [Paramecium tetraurelia]CAK71126.1 unnamed protein product [Paramecium tetraurelia]|eukprot:XP_001438523.1 hypothetical protein (macronuclear) [Paramecium tetraurelia strain d4-2]
MAKITVQINFIYNHRLFYLNKMINRDLELSLYKKKIDLDYSKIQHKFGSINKISPDKLQYHQNNLCCKLFKNANKRKSIQVRIQTIDPLVEKYIIENSGKFFNNVTKQSLTHNQGKTLCYVTWNGTSFLSIENSNLKDLQLLINQQSVLLRTKDSKSQIFSCLFRIKHLY